MVQVTTTTRRAASVPAVDLSYEPVLGSKTYRTVSSARDDAESLSSASRRQDQRLLGDIQTRLSTAAYSQPPLAPRSRARRASSRRGSVSSVASAPATGRRYSLATEDEDFEINFPSHLTTKNLPPCARRALNRDTYHQRRAYSVPPTPRPRASEQKLSTAFRSSGGGFIDLGSPLFRVVDGGTPVKPSTMSSYARELEQRSKAEEEFYRRPEPIPTFRRRYSFAFEDPGEFRRRYDYTPQLRSALAYEVSRPRPFLRRHVPLHVPSFYVEQLPTEGYHYLPAPTSRRALSEARYLPSSSLAVRQARDSLCRIERELGMGSVSLDSSRYDAPYFDEPIVQTTRITPVNSRYRETGWISGSVAGQRRPSYTYGAASRPPPAIRPTRQHEIEARLELMISPDTASPASYASLRDRTALARNKMDQHRTLLDRYLPVPMGTPNEVPYEVEYRYKELEDRMPQLRPRDRTVRSSSVPPIRPVTAPAAGRVQINDYKDALRRAPFKPTMSDTRKRAREVLCRTKRDPHYFDY